MSAPYSQPAGVRSPDGRWYWDGRQWLPVGGPPPGSRAPGPGRPPKRRGGSLKYVLLALGLIGVLLVCAVGGVVALFLNAQGTITLPFLPPTARSVMQKPLSGSLQDARVQIAIKDKQTGKVEQSSGVITFSPKIAMSLTPDAGTQSSPIVVANGLEYHMVGRNIWTAQPEVGTSALGFLSWSITDPEPGTLDNLAADESLPDGLAWHVRDYSGNYDWWIRKSDGFPLKVTNTRAFVTVQYTFSQFNSGAKVNVPSNLNTNLVSGRVGQDLVVPGSAKVNIDQIRDPLPGGLKGGAAHGYRKVGVHVTYTYRGTRPIEVFPLDFPVTDSQGFVGIPNSVGSGAPSPVFPDQSVSPNQTVSGWLAIQVRDHATGLTLQVGDPNSIGQIPLSGG